MLEKLKIKSLVILLLCLAWQGYSQEIRRGICTRQVKLNSVNRPEGYGQVLRLGPTPGYSTVEVCCSGWKQIPYRYPFTCEPICLNGCKNGNCTGPNHCVCHKNYIKNDQQECVKTCPLGCDHGVCHQGRCVCLGGYVLSANEKFCKPSCFGGCGPGGICIGPNQCRCSAGSKMNEKTKKCERHCQQGYVDVNGLCKPHCPRGCTNGRCTAPNVCACPSGWISNKEKTACTPHCYPPCLNGDCTGANICTCRKGYIADPKRKNKCLAHCPKGCYNGQCIAPHHCACNPGYVKDSYEDNVCRIKTLNDIGK